MVFCVILLTLIIPGLTLGRLISWLNLPKVAAGEPTLETRKTLAQVALDEINRLHSSQTVSEEEQTILMAYFNNHYHLWKLISSESGNHQHLESARKKVVQAQRRVLLEIWEQGKVIDKTLVQIEHELDIEETQTSRAEL
ncbi:MAG: hypothetical protein LLF94_06810 [Chlamydiales bacterium]|nr:hypothetical protein [Chlamydiales bacterium]